MRDVEGACGTRDGDVNHNVALLQYFLADAVTFVAYDEGGVSGKLGIVNVCGVGRSLNCDYFFAGWNQFPQVGFLSEIPLYIIAA